MKKTLLAFSAAFLIIAGTSCKKDKDSDCEETVAAVAGSYKLSKVTLNGADMTAAIDDCEKNATLTLNSNKTVTYTEATACAGSGTGDWDIVAGNIVVTHDGNGSDYTGAITNNCSSIVITESGGGFTIVATLAKQ